MTPLAVFAISITAAALVGYLRSLELAKPVATALAPSARTRLATRPTPVRTTRPTRAVAGAQVERPEAA